MMYYAKPDWPYSVAAGGLVMRDNNGQREYLLLFRNDDKYFRWHLPKGIIEEGETLQESAQSEISEEAGVNAEQIAYLGSLHSVVPSDVHGYEIDKTSHYFLCRYSGETGKGIDREHDGAQWCSVEEARQNLKDSPKHEEEIIERAEEWLLTHDS